MRSRLAQPNQAAKPVKHRHNRVLLNPMKAFPAPGSNNSLFLALCLALLLTASVTAQEQPPARVTVAEITATELAPSVPLVGVVDFDKVSSLATETSGLIVVQHVDEGQQVEQGALLLELNTDLLEKDRAIKQRGLEQIEAELRQLSAKRKRLEKLIKQDSASRQAYEEALYGQQALLARRAAIQTEIDRIRLRLAKSKLHAPFAGIVLERLKNEGDWLAPGDPAIRLASTQHLVVKVAVSESLARFQLPGSELPVRIDALDLDLTGKIQRLLPVAERRSRTLTLKLTIPYRPGLAANLSAQVRVPSGQPGPVRLLPRDALISQGEEEQVFILEQDKAKAVKLDIVARQGDSVAVSNDELAAGMKVVMDGNTRLKAGQAIQVVEAR